MVAPHTQNNLVEMKALNQISQMNFSTSASMWGNHYGVVDALYGHIHMGIHIFPMLI